MQNNSRQNNSRQYFSRQTIIEETFQDTSIPEKKHSRQAILGKTIQDNSIPDKTILEKNLNCRNLKLKKGMHSLLLHVTKLKIYIW